MKWTVAIAVLSVAAAYTPLPHPNAGLATRFISSHTAAKNLATRAKICAAATDTLSLAEEVKRRRNLAIISHGTNLNTAARTGSDPADFYHQGGAFRLRRR